MSDGPVGEEGPQGPQGDPGPPGSALVWKDASGAIVANANAAFVDNSFAMTVSDANGVFFGFSPLNGEPSYVVYNSSSLTHYYLANNCTGPARYSLSIAPGVAFKYDGRVIALPADVEVSATAGSAYNGSCYASNYAGAFVAVSVLDDQPTLLPPLVGPGPYHVERN